MTEHRQHPRAPIELEITYRRLNSFVVDYTRNVSKGGMFVKTTRVLPIGTSFVFRLNVPGLPEGLDLTGEVVHARGEGEDAGMGLRFIWSDESARAHFEAVVEKLVTDSLGERVAAALLQRERPDE